MSFYGMHLYYVMRDDEVYDKLASTKSLTWAQQEEIAAGYQEALDNYNKGDS